MKSFGENSGSTTLTATPIIIIGCQVTAFLRRSLDACQVVSRIKS